MDENNSSGDKSKRWTTNIKKCNKGENDNEKNNKGKDTSQNGETDMVLKMNDM